MDIEGDLLRVRGPPLVAEAVDVFTVHVGGEGVVFGGDGVSMVLAVTGRIFDLKGRIKIRNISLKCTR